MSGDHFQVPFANLPVGLEFRGAPYETPIIVTRPTPANFVEQLGAGKPSEFRPGSLPKQDSGWGQDD